MSIENIHENFLKAWSEKPFDVAPGIIDREREADAQIGSDPSTVPYTLERERRMLTDFGRHFIEILHRRAAEIRSAGPLGFAEGDVNWVCEAIEGDRIQAQVCRLLGLMGSSAQVRPDERVRLGAEGFSEREIDEVAAAVRLHAVAEVKRDWFIGPERQVLVFHLDAERIAPTDANVRRLRASALCLMADLIARTGNRYTVAPIHLTDVATDILREPDLPDRAHSNLPTQEPAPRQTPSEAGIARPPEPVEEQQTQTKAVDTRSPACLIALTEALARVNTAPKTRCWDDKTARQHLSTARLFAKVAGTSDARLITQRHIGQLMTLYHELPTNWGKSADDAERTIDEITARIEDLDDNEIGLSAPTIKRHRRELSAILAHAEEYGYPIGKVIDKKPTKDSRPPEEKRRPFSAEEGRMLIASAPWTISDGTAPIYHPSLQDTDSQFWVLLLCWYMLMRLGEACGLMVADIDLDKNEIAIRSNKLRRVKNHSSNRTIPIPPELIRLGFKEFVRLKKTLGQEALFSELFGRATAATVIYNKFWVQILDIVLPHARAQRKTMHSTRKGGNGAMIAGKVMDSVRYYILGHTPKDVHGRHYTPPPTTEEMLEALHYIPNITSTIPTLNP